MRQQASNGHRRPVKDRGWLPTPSNRFWPLPADHELTVCSGCAAVVPASERSQERHKAFHEQIAGLDDGRAR